MYEENEEFDGELMFEDDDFKDEPMFDDNYQFEEDNKDYKYEDNWEDEPMILDTGEVITQGELQDAFDEQQDTTWETEDDYDDYDDYEKIYEDIENTIYEIEKYREMKIKIKRH